MCNNGMLLLPTITVQTTQCTAKWGGLTGVEPLRPWFGDLPGIVGLEGFLHWGFGHSSLPTYLVVEVKKISHIVADHNTYVASRFVPMQFSSLWTWVWTCLWHFSIFLVCLFGVQPTSRFPQTWALWSTITLMCCCSRVYCEGFKSQ